MPIDDFAVVLTGSIIPTAPFTAHNDPQVRRSEYLTAINFYRQFAHVYFLENSLYPLDEDAAFHELSNVSIHKQPVSDSPGRGKGYQEFEMVDRWLGANDRPPPRWFKITGRYLFCNFAALLEDCRRERSPRIIIDQSALSKKARSGLFCVETEFYRQHIAGAYRDCDDASGNWIEYVLYRRLCAVPNSQVQVFGEEPQLKAISGSTGGTIDIQPREFTVKKLLRRINFRFDRRQLWYTH